MTVTAQLTDLQRNICVTLASLRFAREVGDQDQILKDSRRLDWLLSQHPRKEELDVVSG